jgi:hypothetical protein
MLALIILSRIEVGKQKLRIHGQQLNKILEYLAIV